MSDNMNITLKPKYSDFIKIIDNFENKQSTNDNINIHNNSVFHDSTTFVLETPNYVLPNLSSSDSIFPDSELHYTALNIVQDKIIEVPEVPETNSSVFCNKNTSNDNCSNNIVHLDNSSKNTSNSNIKNTLDNREIFDKLHLFILKSKNKSPTKTLSNDNIKENPNLEILNYNNTEHNSSKTDFSESEKLVIKNTKVETKKIKPKKQKKLKINKEDQNEEEQKEKLEELYEKIIYNEHNSNDKNDKNDKKKNSKDELKKICRDFEEHCIMDSTRDFNVKEDTYYINMDILKKNIADFNTKITENYECVVFYRNYKDPKVILNHDKNVGWMEISKTGEKYLTSKNKILSSSLRLFEKTNKFRKTINNIKVRAFKLTFLVYKTNIKIDILALIKFIN